MANPADDKTWPSGDVLDGPKGESYTGNEAGRGRTRVRPPRSEVKDYSDAGNGDHGWGSWDSGPKGV